MFMRDMLEFSLRNGKRKRQDAVLSVERLEERVVMSAPSAPNPLHALAISPTQVRLSWTATANETGYRIDKWAGSAWQQIASTGANTTSYTVAGLSSD